MLILGSSVSKIGYLSLKSPRLNVIMATSIAVHQTPTTHKEGNARLLLNETYWKTRRPKPP